MEPREALARALYEEDNRSREYVPPWGRMPRICRKAWSEDADFVLRHLQAAGFTIARADARKGKET